MQVRFLSWVRLAIRRIYNTYQQKRKIVKKIFAPIVAATLILTGCADSGDTSAFADPEVTTETVKSTVVETERVPASDPKPQETLEDVFIRELDKQNIRYSSRDTAIRAGVATCTYIAEGYSVDDLFYEMAVFPNQQVLPGISNDELPKLMGVAVAVICPEFINYT